MRFYTIESGEKRDGIELLVPVGDDELMLGVVGDDGAIEGIPLSPFMSAGAHQMGLTHLIEGLVAQTPEGPSITTFKRREGKGPLREPDGPCMVLVKTTGVLTSSMFIDVVEGDKVSRAYLGAGDMAGVQILAQGTGQFLLELLPGASFRVEAEAGVLTVRWAGWDRPYPAVLTREYASRRSGLQVRTFTEGRVRGVEQVG